jgi:hypothetical protein
MAEDMISGRSEGMQREVMELVASLRVWIGSRVAALDR